MKKKYQKCMLMMLSLAAAAVVVHAATVQVALQGRTLAGASL